MPINQNYKSNQLAYMLILLVVIFIVSITVAWKIHRNHYLQNRYNKKIAITLIDDITNKMHLNYNELTKGADSLYITDLLKKQIAIQQNTNYLCYSTNDGCSPSTIAANDIFNWQLAIQNNLLNGIGTILWSPSENSIDIQISWDVSKNKPQKTTVNKKLITYKNYYDAN